jgi:hypothetical protein
MATLTASRNTLQMGSDGTFKISVPLKANAKVFKGGMVAIDNATGYGVVPTVATTLISVGVALADADNTGGSNGALSVDVICEGAFLYDCAGQAQTAFGRLSSMPSPLASRRIRETSATPSCRPSAAR